MYATPHRLKGSPRAFTKNSGEATGPRSSLGVITTAHCENAELVGQLQQLLLSEGKTGPEWHEPSRPEAVEAEGTSRFATFLEETGATGYVVHLSCAPALRAAVEAKLRGVKIDRKSVV